MGLKAISVVNRIRNGATQPLEDPVAKWRQMLGSDLYCSFVIMGNSNGDKLGQDGCVPSSLNRFDSHIFLRVIAFDLSTS